MSTIVPSTHAMKPAGTCLVRSALPEDAPAVLECAREVFATSNHTLTKADEFTMSEPQEREFLASILEHPRQVFVIALERDLPGAAVLGMATLKAAIPKRKLRHTVELGMGVRSSHRGRGVGAALLGACMAWAVEHPEIEIVTLGVYADNAAGLALYRRFGFQTYGQLPGGCKHDDGSTWDQVMMYRRTKGPTPQGPRET